MPVISMIDVIRAGARKSLTEEQVAAEEYNLSQRFLKARAEFEQVIRAVAAGTNLPEVEKDMKYLLDAIDDHATSEITWSEMIEAKWWNS